MTIDEIKKKKHSGLFTVKIELAKAFEEDENEEIEMFTQENGESHWIEFREFNAAEMLELQKLERTEIPSKLNNDMQDFIIGNSFKHDNGTEVKAAEVADLIRGSSLLTTYTLGEWQNNLPLTKRMRKESVELHP